MKASLLSPSPRQRQLRLFRSIYSYIRSLRRPLAGFLKPFVKSDTEPAPQTDPSGLISPVSALQQTSPSSIYLTMHNDPSPHPHIQSESSPRLSQAPLFIVTLILLLIAEFAIPGGMTPRRVKQQILAKRVAEQLDLISPTDPNLVLAGGPLPIDTIHRRGLVHRGVWIFALDSHLRLLLAWRAPAMKTCPMTWSTLGEHAITNETFLETTTRGLAEEARFIARPRVYSIGAPFLYHSVYQNGTDDERTDNQWTQAYVVLPRGDALDFRTLDDRDAEAEQAAGENSRYQGMPLPDVVHHAVDRPSYFCKSELSKGILSVIPLVVRVLKTNEKRLFRGYLRDDWATLVQSGFPVCCNATQHSAAVNTVNVSQCGVPCAEDTVDPSDAILAT